MNTKYNETNVRIGALKSGLVTKPMMTINMSEIIILAVVDNMNVRTNLDDDS